ncbi:hypothetical protein KCU99_g445, partial [Aureobasidium melanogenum]
MGHLSTSLALLTSVLSPFPPFYLDAQPQFASLSVNMTDHEEMVNMAEAMAQESIQKIELQAELKFAKRVAAISAAIIEKIEKHTTIHNGKFEILDGLITSTAIDAGEDTLGAGGEITSVLIMAHTINDDNVNFLKQTLTDLKNKLPGEAYVHKINTELSAIAERERAIDKLFEESEDEETIKDEETTKDEEIKNEKKVNAIKYTAEQSFGSHQKIQPVNAEHANKKTKDNSETNKHWKCEISTANFDTSTLFEHSQPTQAEIRSPANTISIISSVAWVSFAVKYQHKDGKGVERIFEDLTNDSDSELPPVQPKNSQPPRSMEKLSKQPIFARTRSEGSSGQNKRQPSVRPPFVRQDSMPSLLDSDDELNEVHMSGYSSPVRSSANDGKHTTKTPQPVPLPIASQKPAVNQAKALPSNDDDFPRDFSVQLSTQIHDYIAEAVGDVDDRVHRIFKDIALKTSLYILENVPCHNSLLSAVNSQIDTNERNARTVNRSLEEVLDAHDSADTGLTPKATDHCKLLDKQERERQKALEGMLDNFEQRQRDKAEVMEAIGAMRRDLREERDDCNRKEVKEIRKLGGERTKEKSKGDGGDDTIEDQESRKRKRDIETEEHIDVDMLM